MIGKCYINNTGTTEYLLPKTVEFFTATLDGVGIVVWFNVDIDEPHDYNYSFLVLEIYQTVPEDYRYIGTVYEKHVFCKVSKW